MKSGYTIEEKLNEPLITIAGLVASGGLVSTLYNSLITQNKEAAIVSGTLTLGGTLTIVADYAKAYIQTRMQYRNIEVVENKEYVE